MPRDLRTLLHDDATPPTRPLDPGDVVATAERRTRRDRRWRAATGAVAVLAVLGGTTIAVTGGGPAVPEVTDEPPSESERVSGPTDEVEIPDGWVTVTAGELAISVPPDWEVDEVDPAAGAPGDAYLGGPCQSDVLPPDGPRIRAYTSPSHGVCNLLPGTPTEHAGIVLYEAILGTVDGEPDQRDGELNDIDQHAVRERIGSIEMWRRTGGGEELVGRQPTPLEEPQPDFDVGLDGFASFVAADLVGGLWVSDVDDPTIQQILATLRPADGATPEPRPIGSRHRDVPSEAWDELTARATDEYLGGGRVVHDQAALDDLWMRLHFDDPAPRLPEGTVGIAAPTYAGGLPGGCHQRRDVIDVEIAEGWATLRLGPLTEGEAIDACSDDPYVHLIAMDAEVARGVEYASTLQAPDTTVELPEDAFEVLAAAPAESTDTPAFLTWEDLGDTWRALGADGEVADPPEGWRVMMIVTDETTTCQRDPADVLGVEISWNSLATIVLDGDGAFAGPCPRPPDADGRPTAFAVAISDRYAQMVEAVEYRVTSTSR